MRFQVHAGLVAWCYLLDVIVVSRINIDSHFYFLLHSHACQTQSEFGTEEIPKLTIIYSSSLVEIEIESMPIAYQPDQCNWHVSPSYSINHASGQSVGVLETNTIETVAYTAIAPSSSWIVNLRATNEQVKTENIKKSAQARVDIYSRWWRTGSLSG